MTNIHRCMIVPDSIVAQVRTLADSFGPAAQNMWVTPLSATGELPATHWISSGLIGDDFAAIMPYSHEVDGEWITDAYDPAAFVALAEAAGVTPPSVEAIQQIMSMVDVSDQQPLQAMERLGLYMVTQEL